MYSALITFFSAFQTVTSAPNYAQVGELKTRAWMKLSHLKHIYCSFVFIMY